VVQYKALGRRRFLFPRGDVFQQAGPLPPLPQRRSRLLHRFSFRQGFLSGHDGRFRSRRSQRQESGEAHARKGHNAGRLVDAIEAIGMHPRRRGVKVALVGLEEDRSKILDGRQQVACQGYRLKGV